MGFAIGFGLVAAVLAIWCGRVVWLERRTAKSGSEHHGTGPYREGETPPEPRESRFRNWLNRLAAVPRAFLSWRETQVSARVSLIAMLVPAAIYGVFAIWGSGVPQSTLSFGEVGFTFSRLWDIAAIIPLVVIGVLAISLFGRLNDADTPDWYDATVALGAFSYGLIGVISVPVCFYADECGIIGLAKGLAIAVGVLGLCTGFCLAFLPRKGGWSGLLFALALFSLANLIAVLPLGIYSGFVVGLTMTVWTTFVFTLSCISICGLAWGVGWLCSRFSSALLAFGRWLIAADYAKKED